LPRTALAKELLALAPIKQAHGPDTVLIVDATLVPSHDGSVSASSKNYRWVNMQLAIDANTRFDGCGRSPHTW
jgi:hypothetical protein